MSYLVGALAGACFPWEWSGWLLGILIGCMAILVGRVRSVHRQSIWLLVGTYLTVATVPRIPRLDLEKCYAGPLWILDAQRAVDPWGGLWRVRLAWPLGSRVEGVWHMMPFRSETFPGGFSAQKVWGNLGLQGEAHWREKGVVDSLHVSGAARWRAAWHARIAGLGWSLRAQQLVHALFLGESRALGPELKRPLQSLGLAHVLAISGFHIGLLWGVAAFLGRWSSYAQRRRLSWLVGLGVWGFVAFIGFPTSAVRAATMATIAGMMRRRSGRPHAMAALGTAVWAMLYIRPDWVWEVGFQLSVAAVAALLWVPPARGGRWGKAIQLTCVAQWGVLPLTLWYFHQFPGAFLPANLLITPCLLAIYPYTLAMLGAASLGWKAPFPEWALDALISLSGWGLKEGIYPTHVTTAALLASTMVGLWAWGKGYKVLTFVAALATGALMYQSIPVPTSGHMAFRRGRGIASIQWCGDSARVVATPGLAKQSFVWEVEAPSFWKARGVRHVQLTECPYRQFPESWRAWASADTGSGWWWDPPR